MDAAHLRGLPRAGAQDMRHGRLADKLPTFDDDRVHRSRDASLFKGPLVLLPEGTLANAPHIRPLHGGVRRTEHRL